MVLLVKVKIAQLDCYSVYKLYFLGYLQSLEGHIHIQKDMKKPLAVGGFDLCQAGVCL